MMTVSVKRAHGKAAAISAVIAVLALAGILYWAVWDDAPFVSPDSHEYMSIAADIEDGGLDNLYDRSFGYPLLLMLADATAEPSRLLYLVQLLMHLTAVFLLAYLLVRLGTPGMLVGAFLVLSLLPPNTTIAASVLTEGLTEFLIVAGTVLLLLSLERERTRIKALLPAVSGLAFGAAAVVRPAYQLLFILLAGIALLIPRAGRAHAGSKISIAVAMIVIPACILGGAYMYSYKQVGFAGLDPSFGIHLSTRTARVVERLPDEYADIREILVANRDSILVELHSQHAAGNYIWRAVPELHEATGLDKPGLSRLLVEMNLVLIRKAPLHYLEDVLCAAILYWFPTSDRFSNFDSRRVQLLWSAVHFVVILIFFLIVLLLTALALLHRLSPADIRGKAFPEFGDTGRLLPYFIIPFSIIVYTMLVSTMFEAGHQRYRTPTDLLIFFIAVLGIHFLRRSIVPDRR